MLSNLKSKLIIPIVGILIILVVFISVYMSRGTAGLADDLTQERIRAASQSARAYMLQIEEYNLMVARAVSGSPDFQAFVRNWNDNINRSENRLGLLQYLNAGKDYYGVTAFVVADHQGYMILRSHDLATYGDSGLVSPIIASALQGISSTVYSSTAAMPMGITGITPIRDATGIIGTISALTNVDTDEFVDNFAATFNAEVTVFAGTERIATTVRDRATGRRTTGSHADRHISETVLERGQILDTQVTLFGVPYQGSYFPLTGWGGNPVGMFFVGFSLQDTIDRTSELQRGLVIIGIIALAITVLIMFLYLTRMLKPLELLTHNLNDIANGDADLTKRLPDTGRDEIAKASSYFNQTMEKFRQLIVSIKKQAVTLSDIGSDLAGNMTETAAAMNEIAANIQSTKGRILNQSASVTETNATMEQVTVNINKLSGNVERQSSAVSNASSAIEQMMANIQSVTSSLVKNAAKVDELQESSEAGRASLQDVVADIQEIARESEGLLEINSVMENIASQTNLLSMNAAIEAAHAGEAGRGFAVVADEIRKLAESSGEQSKVIGNVLKKIKGSMDKISLSTDRVLDRFEAIDTGVKTVAEQEVYIRKAMEEQSHGSKQVLQAAGQVGEITQHVKGESQKMLEGSKEVIQESKTLERLTQEITSGMSDMAAGADQVNKAVNTVNELSGRNQENISSLVRVVSQFKV
ncbi:MAG: methyl-accepting chemotaxis protein [Treponema sp.]|nr:methyl-accepting chemotaxis protein [Treponema sp.]